MFAYLIQDPAKSSAIPNAAPAFEIDGFGQLPKLASTFSDVDGLFYFTYAVCIFFFVLITAVLAFSVVKYRRKTWDQPAASNVTHNTPLEVIWTVIPLIIVMVMFAWGFKGSLDMSNMPEAASRNLHVAQASQWKWEFKYPTGGDSTGELWLEVNKPVGFLLQSNDVLHAFYSPAHRVKRDVIPNRNQTLWFQPTEIGKYHLFCAEYCGLDHSKMYAVIHVVSHEDYAKKPWDRWNDQTPPEEALPLAKAYYQSACSSCHSVNGSPGVGPSWKGLFVKGADGKITGGQRDVFVNGQRQTITVDEAYITESIKNPEAKKAAGFEKNNMTPFPDMPAFRIKGIIEYMKSLANE